MRSLPILSLFALFVVSLSAQAASPTEEREWALKTTTWLEENPLHDEAKVRATQLLKWWTEVPDLTLSVCPMLLETKNKKIAPTVVTQAMFAAGAYLIQHPDASRIDLALAGVEGALRAYSKAIAQASSLRDKFLDGLQRAQAEGKLRSTYIEPLVTKCDEAERSKR